MRSVGENLQYVSLKKSCSHTQQDEILSVASNEKKKLEEEKNTNKKRKKEKRKHGAKKPAAVGELSSTH